MSKHTGKRPADTGTPEAAAAATMDPRTALELLVQALGPLTENLVDLDLFAGEEVIYDVSDVRGTDRHFAVPSDPPFALVLGFLRAHDRLSIAEGAILKAKSPTAHERAISAYETTWRRCVERFTDILRILQPDLEPGSLADDFGQRVLENWMKVAIFRFNLHRLGLSGPKGPEQPAPASAEEPAKTKRRRKR